VETAETLCELDIALLTLIYYCSIISFKFTPQTDNFCRSRWFCTTSADNQKSSCGRVEENKSIMLNTIAPVYRRIHSQYVHDHTKSPAVHRSAISLSPNNLWGWLEKKRRSNHLQKHTCSGYH